MKTVVVARHRAIETALEAARHGGEEAVGKEGGALYTVRDAGIRGRLEEVWDQVERALRSGFERGKDGAQSLFAEAVSAVEKLLQDVGSQSAEIHGALLERLARFVEALIEDALSRVPMTVEIAGQRFALESVEISQKLLASGSIKMNLSEAFLVASQGEIEVRGSYVQK